MKQFARCLKSLLLLAICGAVVNRAHASEADARLRTAGFTSATARAQLTVSLPQIPSPLLSTPATSCAGTLVAALRLGFSGIKISWSGKKPLQGVTAVFAFQNANLKDGRLICEVNAAEFDAAFGTSGAVVNASGTVTNSATCPLQCGGIALVNPAAAFTALGALTVLGASTENGPHVQEQTSVPIELQYSP